MNSMSCMKCGREVALGQAFCKSCLEDMSHYPISPTTPVQIPVQAKPVHTNRRSPRPRKVKKPEEQILRLRKQLRTQAMIIVLLMTMLIVLGLYTYRTFCPSAQPIRPGEHNPVPETTGQMG